MNYEQYDNLRFSSDRQLYLFHSIGPKGLLKKIVAYTPLENLPDSYNLGFGTLKADEKGDEYVDGDETSNNGDRDKILATIATTAYAFTERYPARKIYLRGTNSVRTRLYQMAINHAYNELSEDFRISGDLSTVAGIYDLCLFEKGVNYTGFHFERI